MRTVRVFQLSELLSLAMGSSAAEMVYQHPNLTLVADDESLDSVLKSFGKAKQILVKRPQAEVIAYDAIIEEQAMQNEADMAEYFQSQGIDPGLQKLSSNNPATASRGTAT